MEYYHVHIEHKTARPEIKFDLSRKTLEERIVTCYSLGTDIALSGRVLPLAEIERMRISKTDMPSSAYRDRAVVTYCNRRGKASYDPLKYDPLVDESINKIIIDIGTDVTDDFILGPPGWEANVENPSSIVPTPSEASTNVFIVHGRDMRARDDIFQFIRAIGLHPIEWSEAIKLTGKSSPYVWEILDRAFSKAHAILVLFTPDDEAYLRESLRSDHELTYETQLSGQARPNVLFEAGMAMGRSEDRTVLVELGVLRPFSDIAGRHIVRLDNSPQRRQELAQRLQAAGCPVNLEGTDWHTVGNFDPSL